LTGIKRAAGVRTGQGKLRIISGKQDAGQTNARQWEEVLAGVVST
jgi:hypothetical protein